jgi:hypothetical protein
MVNVRADAENAASAEFLNAGIAGIAKTQEQEDAHGWPALCAGWIE